MKKLLLFAVASISAFASLNACKFLMQNDSSDEILLIDPAVPTEIIKIKTKKEKVIGDPARHVHYRVFSHKGGINNPTFFLEFEMVGCAQPGTQPQRLPGGDRALPPRPVAHEDGAEGGGREGVADGGRAEGEVLLEGNRIEARTGIDDQRKPPPAAPGK